MAGNFHHRPHSRVVFFNTLDAVWLSTGAVVIALAVMLIFFLAYYLRVG